MTIDKSSCPEQYSFIPFSFDVYRFWYLFDQRGRPDGLVHKPNIMIVLSIYNNISQSTIIITVLCGRIQCKPSAIYNHRVTDSGERFFRKYYLCIAIKDDRSRSSRKEKIEVQERHRKTYRKWMTVPRSTLTQMAGQYSTAASRCGLSLALT